MTTPTAELVARAVKSIRACVANRISRAISAPCWATRPLNMKEAPVTMTIQYTHTGRRHVIRFPADHLGLAILGHQWKPAWLLIFGGSAARAAQRAEMTLSSVSRSGTCLLTIGSSTSVRSVSAGCTSGV